MTYELTTAQLGYLMKGIADKGALCPQIDEIAIDHDGVNALVAMGALNQQNQITHDMVAVLKRLANAKAIQQWGLINDDTLYDQTLYYSENDNVLTGLRMTRDGYIIESPFEADQDLDGLYQYIGNSIMTSTDIELELDLQACLLLAGIWDVMRMKQSASLFGNEVIDGVTRDELADYLKSDLTPQGFTYYLKAHMEMLPTGYSYDMDKGLKTLSDLDIAKTGSSISLSAEYFMVPHKLKHIKNVIRLTTAIDSDGVIFSEGIVLQDGLLDMIMFELGSEKIKMTSLSSMGLRAVMELFAEDPEKYIEARVEKPQVQSSSQTQAQPSQQEQASSTGFCGNCGTKRQGDAMFCGNCGSKF